jgi:hypothetical protein
MRLYADLRRRLPQADPAGREMVISCGAALFNLRLAMRRLGFAPEVSLLPDPSCPTLLAEIRWGWFAPPAPDEEELYRSIMRRHTHCGPFMADMPPRLTGDLVRLARQEQAELHVIYDPDQRRLLAGLVHAAELTEQTSPLRAAERDRWSRAPGDARRDGVAVASGDSPEPDGLEFAGRDLAGEARRGRQPRGRPRRLPAHGVVALLSTRDDRPPGWLLAGQALEHMLLHATAEGVSAAFHTQPLELAWARERIRTEFTGGAYPQMLLRLGCGGQPAATPRRPVAETLMAAR